MKIKVFTGAINLYNINITMLCENCKSLEETGNDPYGARVACLNYQMSGVQCHLSHEDFIKAGIRCTEKEYKKWYTPSPPSPKPSLAPELAGLTPKIISTKSASSTCAVPRCDDHLDLPYAAPVLSGALRCDDRRGVHVHAHVHGVHGVPYGVRGIPYAAPVHSVPHGVHSVPHGVPVLGHSRPGALRPLQLKKTA